MDLFPNIPPHEWLRGACGIGFLANYDGRATRDVVRQALEAHGCLTHRGAETRRDDQDAGTSDGAGILFSLYPPFFAEAFGVPLPSYAHPFGLGMFFLPTGADRAFILRTIERFGVKILGWREVPVRRAVLGARAFETCPDIAQVLMARPLEVDPDVFEQRLYRIRKALERRRPSLHIPSFSVYTVVYKGLFRATQVAEFYPDLAEETFQAAVAVYHQRYATNTLPDWSLAQPLRRLCHNGEINTLLGNRAWTRARERALPPKEARRLRPLLGEGSDSSQLDRLVEALTMSGMSPVEAVLAVVPEAYESVPEMHQNMRAWYRLQQATREPWDGPAGLVFFDGRWVIAHLDRNGLRPLFVQETGGQQHSRQVIVASEQGVTEWPGEDVVYTSQLGPGEMVAMDLKTGRCYHDKEIKAEIALRCDWPALAEQHIMSGGTDPYQRPSLDEEAFCRLQMAAGVTQDDLTYFVLPMVRDGKEAVWSMGDDTQLTPYLDRPRQLEDHLRQRFAQVTNPPIDPYRETLVFSTSVFLGKLDGYFTGVPSGHSIQLDSPILSGPRFAWVARQMDVVPLCIRFNATAGDPVAAFRSALASLQSTALAAVRNGARILILSDRRPGSLEGTLEPGFDTDHTAMPMLLVLSRLHQLLLEAGLRTRVGLVTDTAAAWHEHHLACQLGFGADAVHPWMALEWAARLNPDDAEGERFRKVLHRGVVKVMSKMGVCAISAYTGARLFEVLGLNDEVVDEFFPGVAHWGAGVSLGDLVGTLVQQHQGAYAREPVAVGPALVDHGFVRYRKGGIPRAFNPTVFSQLPKVVEETEAEMASYETLSDADPVAFLQQWSTDAGPTYQAWAEAINRREPITVSDRYEVVSDRAPIPLEEVEPVWAILDDRDHQGRVCGGAMSWGALSDEAHEDIARAFNRVGARSNTGEGGERPERFGTSANSETKQVASARFGVTPQYLHHLKEWQIKMAQGSKPGEGGQLPGHKVSADIARVRGADPGVSLISPPPHHDIYSIEDLAELMHELRQFNPGAWGNVKLVCETGVGIVAAGVAKGGANTIHLAGHSGGTGASPLASIKYAGLSWELGVQITHQVLHANDLRRRVKLVVDGGMQTGGHAIKAFLLGAEAVGLGTSLLIAQGCIMARQCHLNTCPTGIATQSKKLRAKYGGKPVHLVKYLVLLAEEIRQCLAQMGYRTVNEIVGRTDLLKPRTDLAGKAGRVNFDRELLGRPLPLQPKLPVRSEVSPLNQRMLQDAQPALDESRLRPTILRYSVRNTDRAIGATLAAELVARNGHAMLKHPIDVHLYGFAGQSLGFGVWGGLRMVLTGRANDYVGKAMGPGGLIAVRPPDDMGCPADSTALVGNTVGYGATGGRLFVNGRAGQRFMCRNAGAEAVVEGVGPHGCEYMTKGRVIVLGEVGLNFGAGMTGGEAYLLNGYTAEERGRLNTDYVRVVPLTEEERSVDGPIHVLIVEHARWTGSKLAESVLRYWEFYARFRFDKVVSIVERAVVT
ncbi:MAG TPA: glutamate synthase large subunit [Candidatus Xenobia bacterium]|jgi:glutamate synthase domain-containing protein 2/glutamate synthase domain-containing protein 1/glutamate synthase domain-containing protein 3